MHDSQVTRPIEHAVDLLEDQRDPRVREAFAPRYELGQSGAANSFAHDGVCVAAEPLSVDDTSDAGMLDIEELPVRREMRECVVLTATGRSSHRDHDFAPVAPATRNVPPHVIRAAELANDLIFVFERPEIQVLVS